MLAALGIELIGAPPEVIRRAEDRERFRETVRDAGLKVPESLVVTALAEVPRNLSFPVILRPAFTLGGHGGGTARSWAEFEGLLDRALRESPVRQVLVEESLLGWDEFELEVIRDRNDNVVIVCSIENLDPMGVHTGDSVTVAPQMTLSDEAYQELRDAAVAVVRAVGVECGGSNIQFARERETGEVRVIEMNPRVSRSSALASKATGYPIAKVAAKLAVGYTLDEIPNDLTGTTPASFEPTLDYVVVKVPRFAFEKFPGADTYARHADEVGRRGDGDRPHLHRGAAEGAALARARRRRASRPGRASTSSPTACIPGSEPSSTASRRACAPVHESRISWPTTGSASSASGCPTRTWPRAAGRPKTSHAPRGAPGASSPRTAEWTPAPARSQPPRTTTTRPGARPTRGRKIVHWSTSGS